MLEFILNFLFPQKPLAREIESMNSAEFAHRAKRSIEPAGKHTIALFEYRDPLVKEAVLQLKYRGNKKVAKLLAELLHEEILAFLGEYGSLDAFKNPLLVFIPLSAKRLRERGYNQCELLADGLERLDSDRNFSVVKNALKKIKDTPSQTKADTRKERLENLEDCFEANASLVTGRHIILIDDVATTGATIEEARKALKTAGAKKVIAFAVAH